MEAIIQEIDVERLFSIFDIPRDLWKGRVKVTIKPIEKKTHETTIEKIAQFRKKYNRQTFVDQLREQAANGHSFDFDVQKVIDGTENAIPGLFGYAIT